MRERTLGLPLHQFILHAVLRHRSLIEWSLPVVPRNIGSYEPLSCRYKRDISARILVFVFYHYNV
jgi:hypothetical protein